MKGATRKHQVGFYTGAFSDVTIYTTGGTFHTVEIIRYIDDRGKTETYVKSFTGEGAYDRAVAFAKKATINN